MGHEAKLKKQSADTEASSMVVDKMDTQQKMMYTWAWLDEALSENLHSCEKVVVSWACVLWTLTSILDISRRKKGTMHYAA
jgi:hypothetical protein